MFVRASSKYTPPRCPVPSEKITMFLPRGFLASALSASMTIFRLLTGTRIEADLGFRFERAHRQRIGRSLSVLDGGVPAFCAFQNDSDFGRITEILDQFFSFLDGLVRLRGAG